MQTRYQVFVSSTYSDLKDEREHVIHELTKVGYIAVGMEQFPATPEEQMEYIRPIIDESDYYVVIIRAKYGSTAEDGISFTEKECQYAVETGKPVLAFLFGHPEKLRLEETDQDPEKMRKLTAFKASLTAKKIVRFWDEKVDLATAVKDTINDMVRRKPGVGWIRGNQAIDPQVYKNLEVLRRENEVLKAKLAESELAAYAHPSNLHSGSDILTVSFSIVGISGLQETRGTISLSWDHLFDLMSEGIYRESSEEDCIWKFIQAAQESMPFSGEHIGLSEDVPRIIRQQFEALGLIESFVKVVEVNPGFGEISYRQQVFSWRFTPRGRSYAATRNAITREQGEASGNLTGVRKARQPPIMVRMDEPAI